MLSYNKKIAKVSFFLFLFFSFFALGFTITNVSAYTSEDMPEGYRLITVEDVGKTFGVDLEPIIYFDTSFSSDSSGLYISFNDSNVVGYPSSWKNVIYRDGSITFRYYTTSTQNFSYVDFYVVSDGWLVESFDFSTLSDSISYPFSIESVSSDFSFIYVKDIVQPSIIDSILSLFRNLVIWVPSVLTGLFALFYSSESGLTFLGALAVAGLGISVIFLLIGIIQNFLHFRG